jgi:mannose-6-phosphate isomerase
MNSTRTSLLNHPLFFNRNRVFRVYQGGKLFHPFFGDQPVDGNLPEEWIASKVKALNAVSAGENEGLSFADGTVVSFAALLEDYPAEMTGGRGFDILVKILDSAVRLPAQTHPDKPFSRKHFHSEHGKTECWLVLQTRPGASIYYGFKDGVTRGDLERAVCLSEEKSDAFPDLMQRVPAVAGDVWLIPARVAHAIGAGCLILEVQEPTDFTIQPERWCDAYRLSDGEMYLGLDPATALDCFDLSLTGSHVIQSGKKAPQVIERSSSCCKEALITYHDTPCFAVNRLTLHAGDSVISGPAVFVVTDGDGALHDSIGVRRLKKGDYFFVTVAAGSVEIRTDTSIQLVECLPPIQA